MSSCLRKHYLSILINLNKNVRKLNEEQKIYIIEKDMKKFNEIDNKIKEKKDKIFRLNAETKSIENQQKEILKESIKDLKKKIGLLEVEYEVVKKYNNTYRMNEIKLEIMNKNYKIQTVQDEINSLDKEKVNAIELQVTSLKKYIADLEEENLNDVYDSNLSIYEKNEKDIEKSNKQMLELKQKLKKIHKEHMDKYKSDIKHI
jgi:hypothetical protein